MQSSFGARADHQRCFVAYPLDPVVATSRFSHDERLQLASQTSDPGLAALVFQYGRYLDDRGSRPGGQPANLQGLWNEVQAAVGQQVHLHINTEMNYWPARSANLAECQLPLFRMQ